MWRFVIGIRLLFERCVEREADISSLDLTEIKKNAPEKAEMKRACVC